MSADPHALSTRATAAILAGGKSRRMGPYCSPDLFRSLLDLVADHDVAIPLVAGRWQTMHAVYRRTCLPAVEAALSRGDLRVMAFFSEVRVRAVGTEEVQRIDPELRSLIDLDTPDELARARRTAVVPYRSREPRIRRAALTTRAGRSRSR